MSGAHPPKPEGKSAFADGPKNPLPKNEGRGLWGKAQSKAVSSIKFSQSFVTLRDMIKDAEIPYSSLTKVERLGEGAFAVVDKCIYRTDDGFKREVAVKRLKPEVFRDELDVHDFVKEALLLKKLRNTNIVDLIGLGTAVERTQGSSIAPEMLYVVTEYMDAGTLYSKIVRQMKSTRTIYTVQQGLQWLIQVAKGIKYLHNSNPRVIHRDIKIENVMLTNDGTGNIVAKIGDFGLHALVPAKTHRQELTSSKKILRKTSKVFLQHARSVKEGKITYVEDLFKLSGKTGSLMYMAPEVLKSEPYNEKADVFSFSIVIYEVLQKCMLLAFISLRGLPSEVDQYIASVLGGFRPIIPKEWPAELRILLKRCWANRISERPTMDIVLDTLVSIQSKDIMKEEETPKKAFDGCMCCSQQ